MDSRQVVQPEEPLGSHARARSLPQNQRMARVQIDLSDWQEFLSLAARRKGSVASYLGHLVQKELLRARRKAERTRLKESRRLSEVDLETGASSDWNLRSGEVGGASGFD